MTWARRAIITLSLVLGLVAPAPVRAQGAVVEAILFYSETCSHCHHIMTEFLPPLLEKYGDSVAITEVNVATEDGYRLLTYIDTMGGVPQTQRGVPQMVVGERVLIGSDQIEDGFVTLVDTYLAEGGFDLPTMDELMVNVEAFEADMTATATAWASAPTPAAMRTPPSVAAAATATASVATATPPPIYLAYFFQPGCDECSQAELDLQALQRTYPQLVVERYSVVDDAALAEWLGEQYGVPEDRRQVAPAVYVDGVRLEGEETGFYQMQALVQRFLDSGAPRTWDGWEAEQAGAEDAVIQRFQSFGLLTVLGAGLIDGVNPCAFATLVFFVSYLTVLGRNKRQILATGVSFTLGVFLTYLVIGLGLYRLLSTIPAIATAGKVIYAVTAVICLVLAGLSLYDFLQARRGRSGEMALKLPSRLRKRVNTAIRESMSPGRAAGAALITGVVVSVVELACTGQIYLPTLMFVAGRPELRATALPLLAAYNLAFVTPLVIVFAVTAYGVGSDRLRRLLARHTGTVKLLTALLFLGLAAWLASMVI